ncbi:NEW3 domain-containing protein [Zhaonella formicivorans]|uniref:COG1470 family protein n=1 Tax=Zhaonella formicivorans TaxID=2528593 RepID=UPI0010E1FCC9|nr:NEW3 domain-containing protein [Zhaonella formicivorans]
MKKGALEVHNSKFIPTQLTIVLLALLSLTLICPLQPAAAQKVLELSTPYPSISGSAGENITFPLTIKNNSSSSQVINLEIKTRPDNWVVALRGDGREIQQVFVSGNGTASADLKVKIQDNPKPGDYGITVWAFSDGGTRDVLKLNVKIAKDRQGEDELAAQYSELKGPSNATFNFKLDLINNGSTEQIYSLGARAPEGWQVTFKPSYENQQVASISIKPGESKGLDVAVTPPASVQAGEYVIPVEAVSAAGKVAKELKLIITGTYDLELNTPSGRLNAEVVAGKEKKLNLVVKNNGSAVINNITLSSRQPQEWSMSFEPNTIDTLQPGESRQITATITAGSKAIAGDYVVAATASSPEVSSTAELRVTVKTSTLWGIVGIAIVLLVLVGVYKVFQTYGRR